MAGHRVIELLLADTFVGGDLDRLVVPRHPDADLVGQLDEVDRLVRDGACT